MPGVTWTEATVAEVAQYEGVPQATDLTGFALFGMPIPLDGATVWGDVTSSYTEATVASGTITEVTVPSTSYTEVVI